MMKSILFTFLTAFMIFFNRLEAKAQYEPEIIYDYVEEMPILKGKCEKGISIESRKRCSEEAILTFIQKNIIYPQIAKEEGHEGTVYLQIIVNKLGEVENIEVKRKRHDSLNKAAVEVIRKLPPFVPGKQNGTPVNVRYTIPISFKL